MLHNLYMHCIAYCVQPFSWEGVCDLGWMKHGKGLAVLKVPCISNIGKG